MQSTRRNRRSSISRASRWSAAATGAVLVAGLALPLQPATAEPVAFGVGKELTAANGASIPTAAPSQMSQAVTARVATIGAATYAVAGTNVPRGVDQLVVYTPPLTVTPTNQWGTEVVVVGGKVTAVNYRQATGSTAGTRIPTNGYVLSGHGAAKDWLNTRAKVGTVVGVDAPVTPPVTPPVIGDVATIGTARYAISGTNTPRGVDQLVAYTAPLTVTPTNMWGTEVTVVGGKVTAVNNRQTSGSTTGTSVPANGYVLSGHNLAMEWLRANAGVGAVVSFGGTVAPPVLPPPGDDGTSSSAPMALPAKVVSLYHMMWSNSGSPLLRHIPAGVNVVNLAFLQGDPPRIVGWGSQGEASFIADAKALRARGVRIVASVGGAHGQVNIANRSAFVDAVMALNAKLPLDGLDWDLEGTAMGTADVVWISRRLKDLRGENFSITMAPNGSNIDQYRAIAVELQKVGALDLIGQQFYDAVVSKEAAKGRVDQLIGAGIPQSRISIGMMVGPESTYWTVDESMTAVSYIKQAYPNLRGGYLWESGRAGTADWVTRVGALLRK